MTNPKNVKIHKYHDFQVLDVEGFDRIVFGCPPGVVKEFSRKNHELPKHFVIPIRTFVKGRNIFDFEFIIYSFLFIHPERRAEGEKITIYCTQEQKERFKVILNETLFGPKFEHLLHGQFRRFAHRHEFSIAESKKLESFLGKISGDNKLLSRFDGYLKSHTADKTILAGIREYFNSKGKISKWLADKKISNLDLVLAVQDDSSQS